MWGCFGLQMNYYLKFTGNDINFQQSFRIKFHKNWTRCPNGTTWYTYGFLLLPFLVQNMKMCFLPKDNIHFPVLLFLVNPVGDALYNIMKVQMLWWVVFSTNLVVSSGTVSELSAAIVILWICVLATCILGIWMQALVYGFHFIR
jgi:hypothetical protein